LCRYVTDALKTSEGTGLAMEAAMAAVRDCVHALKSLIAIVTGLRWLKQRWQRAMVALRDGTYKQPPKPTPPFDATESPPAPGFTADALGELVFSFFFFFRSRGGEAS
jgi:hypothetical protein